MELLLEGAGRSRSACAAAGTDGAGSPAGLQREDLGAHQEKDGPERNKNLPPTCPFTCLPSVSLDLWETCPGQGNPFLPEPHTYKLVSNLVRSVKK